MASMKETQLQVLQRIEGLLKEYFQQRPVPAVRAGDVLYCPECGTVLGGWKAISSKFNYNWLLECPGCGTLLDKPRNILVFDSVRDRWRIKK